MNAFALNFTLLGESVANEYLLTLIVSSVFSLFLGFCLLAIKNRSIRPESYDVCDLSHDSHSGWHDNRFVVISLILNINNNEPSWSNTT